MIATILQEVYNLSAESVCYSILGQHEIQREGEKGMLKYSFHKEDFPSKWKKLYTELDYGNAFESQTGCGAKTYEISCDNSLFGDDVVWLTDEGHLVISPYMVQSDDM